MTAVLWVVLPGLLGAPVLAALPGWRAAAVGNIVVCGAMFLAACHLALVWPGERAGPDGLGVVMALLTGLVGFTTAWFSRYFIAAEVAAGRIGPRALRLYHGGFAGLLGLLAGALLTNDVAVTWIFLELAGLLGAGLVMLAGTGAARAAGRRSFVLCGVAGMLALFGVILLHVATGPGWSAMRWQGLGQGLGPGLAGAVGGNGGLAGLAFVFLLVGYGTKAGLVPLHGWLVDAVAEGPAPVSAILSGLVCNVALVVLLRLRGAFAPGTALLLLGLGSVLVGSVCVWAQRDVKRVFGFAGIGQNGVVALAFGLGGPAGNFAGLLCMILGTLARAAIFQSVGCAAQVRGGQTMGALAGLSRGQPVLGMTLAAGVVALAGLPPFGLFAAWFMLVSETTRAAPWVSPVLVLALAAGGWALMAKLLHISFDTPPAGARAAPVGAMVLAGAWFDLALVLLLGLAMPAGVLAVLRQAAGP